MEDRKTEEIFEALWTLRENGTPPTIENISHIAHLENPRKVIERLVEKGILAEKEEKLSFTTESEKKAAEIIRRHRLAEVLLHEVLAIESPHMESNACKFEHVLSPRVTNSVCTFLGHPPFCPHGKPIPRGSCCFKFQVKLKPLVLRLSDLQPGEEGKIRYITSRVHPRMERLSSLGVVPDSVVKLRQKKPSFVIEIGHTIIAIDQDIAKNIFVQKT